MERPLIWPWGTFVGFSALSFLLTHSLALSIVLGLAAAITVWLATNNVSTEWRARLAESLGVAPVDVEAAAVSTSRAAAQLALLRDALDQLPDGILITAADGTVLAANAALTRVVATRAGEPLRNLNLLDAIRGASLMSSGRALTVELEGQPLTVSVSPLQGGSALVFGR